MIVVPLDAGASKAGMVGLRVSRSGAGVVFTCLRHAHLDLEMDGAQREETALDTLIALADWALAQREAEDEPIVFAVEGVEGHVYKGRSATSLFDTADQAGFVRGVLRCWARWRGVRRDTITVRKTTARAVRLFLFGREGASAGDNEVVIAVRACVKHMPPLSVPVPDSRRPEYRAMHAYDAAAVGLVVAAQDMRWTRIRLPDTALAELAKYKIANASAKAEKKVRDAVKAAGGTVPKAKRIVSRGTRRRISEASKAAKGRS